MWKLRSVVELKGTQESARSYLLATLFGLDFFPPFLATFRFGLALDDEDTRMDLPVPPFPLVFDSYNVPPQSWCRTPITPPRSIISRALQLLHVYQIFILCRPLSCRECSRRAGDPLFLLIDTEVPFYQ